MNAAALAALAAQVHARVLAWPVHKGNVWVDDDNGAHLPWGQVSVARAREHG